MHLAGIQRRATAVRKLDDQAALAVDAGRAARAGRPGDLAATQRVAGAPGVEEVRRRERIVAIDDEAVLMAPYASRSPFHLMIAPRRGRARFEDDGPTGAALLHDALTRLKTRLGVSPPLNLCIRTAPRGAEHFCWRIEIVPRLTNFGGVELGTGVNVNIVAPEQAAAELR